MKLAITENSGEKILARIKRVSIISELNKEFPAI